MSQPAFEAVQQLRDDFGSQGTVQVAIEMFAEGSWPQPVRQAAALAVASLCCRHPEHQRLFRKAEVSPTQCARAVQGRTRCARLLSSCLLHTVCGSISRAGCCCRLRCLHVFRQAETSIGPWWMLAPVHVSQRAGYLLPPPIAPGLLCDAEV